MLMSESEASAFPTAYEKADSSAMPQNDILTQSLGERGEPLTGPAKNRLTLVLEMP
jgi:hypothetical protein